MAHEYVVNVTTILLIDLLFHTFTGNVKSLISCFLFVYQEPIKFLKL